VLLVLAVLGVLGALEAAAQHRAAGQGWLLMALCGVAAGAVGVLALRRYLFLLVRAEHIANQANCPQCRAYARWSVEPTAPPGPAASVLQVRCKACHTHWSIHC
jgi:hypothetical protein